MLEAHSFKGNLGIDGGSGNPKVVITTGTSNPLGHGSYMFMPCISGKIGGSLLLVHHTSTYSRIVNHRKICSFYSLWGLWGQEKVCGVGLSCELTMPENHLPSRQPCGIARGSRMVSADYTRSVPCGSHQRNPSTMIFFGL